MGEENRTVGWQPIETAPKDRPIIAWAEDWPHPKSIRWHSPWKEWVASSVVIHFDWSEVSKPTHWHPIPAPPEQSK